MSFYVCDEILAHQAAQGDLVAFEQLLARHRDRVYRFCYRMAGNPEDAEDWAQECFVRTFRQLGRYDPTLPFVPWLLRVVSNPCLNLAKQRGRQQSHVQPGLQEQFQMADLEGDPLHQTLSAVEAQAVRAAIDALSPPLREAVVLRVLEGLSFREIAQVLDVPLQTAATRVRRALQQVREELLSLRIEVDT
jgi:RNA polymerase sigma-70 factor, ECF subfamily